MFDTVPMKMHTATKSPIVGTALHLIGDGRTLVRVRLQLSLMPRSWVPVLISGEAEHIPPNMRGAVKA